MSGTMIALLLLVGLYLVVGVIEFGLFVVAIGVRRGEATEAPGPTDDGAVPDCDCEDCEYEREFAAIVGRTWSDA